MRTAQNILNIRVVVKLPYSLTVGCLLGASVSRYMLPYIKDREAVFLRALRFREQAVFFQREEPLYLLRFH